MNRKCPICKSSDLAKVIEARYTGCGAVDYPFSLLKCPQCELHAVDPMPSNQIYPVSRNQDGDFRANDLESTFEWNLPLLKNVRKYVQQGELLDLGCNSGDFMKIAEKNGFRCTGVEIDHAAAQAGQKLGRNVIEGDFITIDFKQKFDAIVMNHTLEHIPNFLDVPSALHRLIKPQGTVVINVPYYQSWLGQLLKEKWSQMAPFTHAWFFSKKNIETLFSPYFDSIEMFTKSSCEPHTVRTFQPKPLIKGLVVRLFRFLGHGDELRVVLRQAKIVSSNQREESEESQPSKSRAMGAIAKAVAASITKVSHFEKLLTVLGRSFPSNRVIRSLCYHTGLNLGKVSPQSKRVTRMSEGFDLEIVVGDHMLRHMYFYGKCDEALTSVLNQCVRTGETWLDIGANVGYFSHLLAKLVGETGRVLSFEPNPKIMDLFKNSLAMNNFKNVEPFEYAVADGAQEELTLYVPQNDFERSSIIIHQDLPHLSEIKVKSTTLDQLITSANVKVDGLKIDIEGAEILAFRGFEKTLRHAPPRMIIAEASHRPECLARPNELIKYLEQFGYRPYRIRDTGLEKYNEGEFLHPHLDGNLAFLTETSV